MNVTAIRYALTKLAQREPDRQMRAGLRWIAWFGTRAQLLQFSSGVEQLTMGSTGAPPDDAGQTLLLQLQAEEDGGDRWGRFFDLVERLATWLWEHRAEVYALLKFIFGLFGVPLPVEAEPQTLEAVEPQWDVEFSVSSSLPSAVALKRIALKLDRRADTTMDSEKLTWSLRGVHGEFVATWSGVVHVRADIPGPFEGFSGMVEAQLRRMVAEALA